MKSKHTFLCLLALGASACTSETTTLRLLNARTLDDACAIESGDVSPTEGSIDVGQRTALGRSGYILAFSVKSTAGSNSEIPLDVNGDPIVGEGGSDVTVSSVELTYGGDLDIADQKLAYYAVIPAGATAESFVSFNALPPAAFTAVVDAMAGREGPVLLTVGARLKGETSTGSSVESNEAVFPLTVTNTPLPACPPPGDATLTQRNNPGECGGAGLNGGAACVAP